MNKLVLVSAFALSGLLAGGAAIAQPYVGASVGRSDYQVDCTGTSSCDTTDVGYKLFAGYAFTPHLGVEASAFDLGKANGTVPLTGLGTASVEARTRGVGLYGVASLPVNDFTLFAKAGFAYTQAKIELKGAVAGSDDDWKLTPAFGVGAGFAFTPRLGARVEWERIRVEFPGAQKEDVDLISAGVVYRF